jgi:C4-dicarboxylate transporter DctQ subunit
MAKFGAAYGVRTGIHVGVDVLISSLPNRTAALALIRACGRVHHHRRHARRTCVSINTPTRFPTRSAALDRLPVHTARLVPDVLPARSRGLSKTGELPHHDHGHVEGLESVTPIDINPYGLRDNLHPADVTRGGRS